MPKAKKNKSATAASLPYGSALASKLPSISKSTLKHNKNAAAQKRKKKQMSLMSYGWGKKQISEWKVDAPENCMVLSMSNDCVGTPNDINELDINELFERKAAAMSMEGQALLLAQSGDYVRAEEMQIEADQLKARVRPCIGRYYDMVNIAKKAALAKNYHLAQKKYLLAGQWDELLKAAQHLAKLDDNNNPIKHPTDASLETIDLVANSGEDGKEDDTVVEEEVNEADAEEDTNEADRKEDICIAAADGTNKRLDDVMQQKSMIGTAFRIRTATRIVCLIGG